MIKIAIHRGPRRTAAVMVSLASMLLVCGVSWSAAAERDQSEPATKNVLDRVERRITKEPKYAAAPKYALIAVGPQAESKVWLVEDGKTLYIDKNANGDLTDDGPPVEPTKVHNLGQIEPGVDRWDFDYVWDEITPAGRARHTDFCLRRWNYGGQEDSYGLSLNVNGQMPMYAGWFGTFWAPTPGAVPVIHFGGALEPRMLRRKDFVVGAGLSRLSVAFINGGASDGAMSRLSIEALPKSLVPKLRIDWPVADGAPSLQTSYPLRDRCCYWEFYEPDFQVPSGAAAGEATVTVEFEGGEFPFELTKNQVKVPVLPGNADKTGK